MKEKRQITVGDISVNQKKLYNPNRVNGVTAAITFALLASSFIVVPLLVSAFFRDILIELYAFDTLAYMLVNTLLSQTIIFVIALGVSVFTGTNPFNGGGYTSKKDCVQALMGAAGIIGIMTLFYSVHSDFAHDCNLVFSSTQIGAGLEEHYSNLSGLFAVCYLVVMTAFPAIIEEMAFRGIIMRGLEQFGSVFAVICSSAAFSLMHGNFSQVILQFFGGLAIGSVVMITKNRFTGCFMHFFNNAFSVGFALVFELEAETLLNARIFAAAKATAILVGVACLVTSVVYFASFFADNKKREFSGVKKQEKYAVKKYYAMKIGEESALVASENAPQLKLKSETDERLFFIRGKYRRLNRKSNALATYILLGVGALISIIGMFI